MAKKLGVDQKKCIGCGACVSIALKTFKLNDKGKSIVINSSGDDEETIQNSIDSCPVGAISWEE